MAYVMLIVFFLMSIGSMSHVEFKKQPCRPVEFKGQGPYSGDQVASAGCVCVGGGGG